MCYNKSIQVDKASVQFLTFSEKSINYVSQLFSDSGSIKNSMNLRENTTYIKVHILNGYNSQSLDKLTSTEIYFILISKVQNKPSCNIYVKNLFDDYNIDWTAIYMAPRLVTYNNYVRYFQYKILNNVLFLNKDLHTFGIKPSLLCSFCNLYDKTPLHIFYYCDAIKYLWAVIVQCFQNNLILPTLTPQAAIFGILESASNDSILKIIKYILTTLYLHLSFMRLSPE